MKKLASVLLVCALTVSSFSSSTAQNTMGRWSLGIRGGGNLWLNDFEKHKIGPGGDLVLNYGFSPYFSLGVLTGLDVLKGEQPPASEHKSFYYMRMNSVPAALIGTVHLFPRKIFTSYIYAGGGYMGYQRFTDNGTKVDNGLIPSFVVMGGLGFEYFVSSGTSLVLDLGYRNIDKKLDAINSSNIDGVVTARVGLNFYFGSSD